MPEQKELYFFLHEGSDTVWSEFLTASEVELQLNCVPGLDLLTEEAYANFVKSGEYNVGH